MRTVTDICTVTVEGLISIIESGEGGRVSFSRCQLADLFGVYYGTITTNVKVLIKSGAVNPSFKGTVVQVGNTVLPECYDMEMVIALAFRLNTPVAERIRRYVVERAIQPTPVMVVFAVIMYMDRPRRADTARLFFMNADMRQEPNAPATY